MKRLRPWTILVIGPVSAGAITAVSFFLFSPDSASAILGAIIGAIGFVPLFLGLAWAVAPIRFTGDLNHVLHRYQWFSRWLSFAGVVALMYVVGCRLFHLDKLFGVAGDGLFIAAGLTLLVMSFRKIVIHERLKRLRELGS